MPKYKSNVHLRSVVLYLASRTTSKHLNSVIKSIKFRNKKGFHATQLYLDVKIVEKRSWHLKGFISHTHKNAYNNIMKISLAENIDPNICCLVTFKGDVSK